MGRRVRPAQGARRGQALAEFAIVAPVLLLLVFALIGLGRVTTAKLGVAAAARECARAAIQDWGQVAVAAGSRRASDTASGYHLDPAALGVEVRLEPERATCTVRYSATLRDLPLLGWASAAVEATGREPIGKYRDRVRLR
jgi:Flp pilus assembly protein TadG